MEKATLPEILWFSFVTLASLAYLLFAGIMGYWPFGGEGLQWVNALIGMIIAFIYFALIIPDTWSEWLSKRKNSPIMFFVIGALLVFISSTNFFPIFGKAVSQILKDAVIQPWVFIFLFVGTLAFVPLLVKWIIREFKGFRKK